MGTLPNNSNSFIIDSRYSNSGLKTHGPMKLISGLVIHYTGDGYDTIKDYIKDKTKNDKNANYTTQFVIDKKGKVWRVVPENQKTWHVAKKDVGTGTRGKELSGYGNDNLEGVEIMAKDEKHVTPQQIAAAQQLVYEHSKRFSYDPKTHVFGHGELSGNRAKDEGMRTVNEIRSGSLSQFESQQGQQSNSQTLSPGNKATQQNTQQSQQINPQTLSSGNKPSQQNNQQDQQNKTQTLSSSNKPAEQNNQQDQQNKTQTLSSGNKPAEQNNQQDQQNKTQTQQNQSQQNNSQTNNNIQR